MDFQKGPERICYRDLEGRLLAEVDFPTKDGVAEITHTFVDDVLRGHGVANQLLAAAAEQIRTSGLRVKLTCPYAKAWFPKHPEYSDMVIPE